MSSAVVGRSSSPNRSETLLEVIEALPQTMPFEVTLDLPPVHLRQLEEESDVGHLLERSPRIVLHCHHLQSREMLGFGQRQLEASRRPGDAAGGKTLFSGRG